MGSVIPERQIMQLVNTTPLQASVGIAQREDGARLVRVTAKATFHFAPEGGAAWIEGSDAEPIRSADEVSSEGTFPRDDQLPDDGRFEVFFFGDVTSGTPVTSLEARLAVDDERRSLLVFGDRAWSSVEDDASASAPIPFNRMPLAPSHAFGGTCTAEVDENAHVDFTDVRNLAGKGHVAAVEARTLSEHIGAAPIYPRFASTFALANLEHPNERVTTPRARPRPAHWAAHPLRYTDVPGATYSATNRPVVDLGRAHPDWQLAQFTSMPRKIALQHLSEVPETEIALPAGEAIATFHSGSTRKAFALRPRRLFVIPKRRRVAVLFAATIVVERPRGQARTIRIAWQDGGGS